MVGYKDVDVKFQYENLEVDIELLTLLELLPDILFDEIAGDKGDKYTQKNVIK